MTNRVEIRTFIAKRLKDQMLDAMGLKGTYRSQSHFVQVAIENQIKVDTKILVKEEAEKRI